MKTPKSLVCLALSLVAPWAQAIELIGQTVSLSSVNVVAEVNGVIETMDVEVGDKVQQYTVIAEIKKQDFQFEL
ncbi:hypothetical protein, partial [Pseudomonas sp. Kh14]